MSLLLCCAESCGSVCSSVYGVCVLCVFFFNQKTAYEMRSSDWSADVCSSDLEDLRRADGGGDRAAKIFVVFEFAKIGLDLIDRRCGSDRDCVRNVLLAQARQLIAVIASLAGRQGPAET